MQTPREDSISVLSLIHRLGKLERAAEKADREYNDAKLKRDEARRKARDFRTHLKALNIRF